MILLREVTETDLDGLENLSRIAAERHPGFLNITNDRDQWREKVRFSQESFADRLENKFDSKFVFVAEEIETRRIVGVSMIASQHGTPDTPHFFFDVAQEQKFSQTINTGFIHGTLKLKYDTNGPTEIGGLLVDPDFRNAEDRIGRQISFIRFLFLGLNRPRFKKKVLAELLPPLTKRGKSPLWEAIGRRFTNMDYTEADLLSSKNKEFIFSLFPTGKIYVTFLPAEARNAIGKVSKDTEPVMHMLKKIGFQYRNQVDPFDGGPHLIANVDEITPIQNIRSVRIAEGQRPDQASIVRGLLTKNETGAFRAMSGEFSIEGQQIWVAPEIRATLGISVGDAAVFMPYY